MTKKNYPWPDWHGRTQKQQKEQKEANRIAEEISIATKGNATKEEIYYLKEVDGYVVVYKEDKETIFEVTSIRVESLPEEIKAEVRNEKKIEGTKKLYGFLENYSSWTFFVTGLPKQYSVI